MAGYEQRIENIANAILLPHERNTIYNDDLRESIRLLLIDPTVIRLEPDGLMGVLHPIEIDRWRNLLNLDPIEDVLDSMTVLSPGNTKS